MSLNEFVIILLFLYSFLLHNIYKKKFMSISFAIPKAVFRHRLKDWNIKQLYKSHIKYITLTLKTRKGRELDFAIGLISHFWDFSVLNGTYSLLYYGIANPHLTSELCIEEKFSYIFSFKRSCSATPACIHLTVVWLCLCDVLGLIVPIFST